MVSHYYDITDKFNGDNGFKIDVGLWENVSVQFVNPSGTISILGSNDPNAITGVSDGNALASTNYVAIQATNLETGTAVTSVSTAGIYKVQVATKFIQFGGAGAAADKVLVFMNTR
jgi:hypothetical protein